MHLLAVWIVLLSRRTHGDVGLWLLSWGLGLKGAGGVERGKRHGDRWDIEFN